MHAAYTNNYAGVGFNDDAFLSAYYRIIIKLIQLMYKKKKKKKIDKEGIKENNY